MSDNDAEARREERRLWKRERKRRRAERRRKLTQVWMGANARKLGNVKTRH